MKTLTHQLNNMGDKLANRGQTTFEVIMDNNFPNMMKAMNPQLQEGQHIYQVSAQLM